MRLLHTADWHVGKVWRGLARQDEFAAALDEVVEIARREQVDAVLVAGDIFEHQAPSPDAERLVYGALARLHAHGIPAVLLAGNHDHPGRLEALASLLDVLKIRVSARVRRPENGGVIEIASRDGRERAVVACLPFVPERYYVKAATLFAGEEKPYTAYEEGVGDVIAGLAEAFRPDAVNVLMGHVMIDGAAVGGGERQLTIGRTYAVSPARLPGTATYIALGHVHRPQAVAAAPAPTYFAGSLLPLDFGEAAQRKSVVLVEAHPGRPAKAEVIPLSAGRPLLEVSGTLADLRARAEEWRGAHLRVTVMAQTATPGLAEVVREILPGAVEIRLSVPAAPEQTGAAATADGLRTPRDLLRAYYLEMLKREPAPEVLSALDHLLDEAQHASPAP